MDTAQIDKLFEVQPIKSVRQLERKQEVRMAAQQFAQQIATLTSHSLQRNLAVHKVQEAMHMAIAAIDNE